MHVLTVFSFPPALWRAIRGGRGRSSRRWRSWRRRCSSAGSHCTRRPQPRSPKHSGERPKTCARPFSRFVGKRTFLSRTLSSIFFLNHNVDANIYHSFILYPAEVSQAQRESGFDTFFHQPPSSWITRRPGLSLKIHRDSGRLTNPLVALSSTGA